MSQSRGWASLSPLARPTDSSLHGHLALPNVAPDLELVSSWECMNHSRPSKLQSKAPVHGQCQWSLLRRPQSPSCLAPVLGPAEPPSLREWVARALRGLPPFFGWPTSLTPSPQRCWPGHPRPSLFLPKASPSLPRANADSTEEDPIGYWREKVLDPRGNRDPGRCWGGGQRGASGFSESGRSVGKESGLETALRSAASACIPPGTGSSPLLSAPCSFRSLPGTEGKPVASHRAQLPPHPQP